MGDQDEPDYNIIADELKAGEVVPFFGAAASAVYRPDKSVWIPGQNFMPFGSELSRVLARVANYPDSEQAHRKFMAELARALRRSAGAAAARAAWPAIKPLLLRQAAGPPDLAFVASYLEHVKVHRRYVNRHLRESFNVDCTPGRLHMQLAAIEAVRLYVTTNYDNMLEKALAPRNPHIVVDRGNAGLWMQPFGEAPRLVENQEELYALSDANGRPTAPILFKMHGSVDLADKKNDSFLITEEDYVDFLGREGRSYVPAYISGLMEEKDFLFLGYSLEDWNVRVILRKLLRRPSAGGVKFWAIVRGRSDAEQKLWRSHNLEISPVDLHRFSDRLGAYL